MKKVLWAGAILSIVFGLAAVTPVQACIDPVTGEPGVGTDGQMTNCASAGEQPADQSTESYTVSTEEVDFGRLTEAGRSYTKTFSVTNNTDKKLIVRGEIIKNENADIKDDYKLASGWMTFVGGVRRFEVAANATANISVRVVLPVELAGSTQYATVRLLDEEGFERKVNVRMDVVTDDFKYGGNVGENELGFVALKETVDGSAVVKNEGTASFKAQYFVQYKNAFGLSEWKTIIDTEREVAPGTEVRFTTADDGDVAIGYGIFKVEQKIVYVNAENKKVEMALSHVVVNIPIWLLCVVGGVILLIIILVIVIKAIRRRREEDDDEEDEEESENETDQDDDDESEEDSGEEEEEKPVRKPVASAAKAAPRAPRAPSGPVKKPVAAKSKPRKII